MPRFHPLSFPAFRALLGLCAGLYITASPAARAALPVPKGSAGAQDGGAALGQTVQNQNAGEPKTAPANAKGDARVPARSRPEPDTNTQRACSMAEAVCVHASLSPEAGISEASMAWTLRAAERTLRAMRDLGLAAPLPDGFSGGTPALDIYLETKGSEPPWAYAEMESCGYFFDRCPAFVLLPPPSRTGPEACVHEQHISYAIAHAALLGLDAGAEAGSLAMAAGYIASLLSPCAPLELDAVNRFQLHPERTLLPSEKSELDGSFLFPSYLDQRFGTGGFGQIITALIAVGVQRTEPLSMHWQNEPDVFDALRNAMRERGQSLDELMLDFSVARAFVGSRSDEDHLRDSARFGDSGRVRFEWTLPYASLPRRLAPLRPIAAMGATYLWLDLSSAKAGAELTFVADWELDVLFRWALVKVDPKGREAGRIDVAGIYGSRRAERTVRELSGLAGLLIVGTNTGSVDPGRPFDPDDTPAPLRSYTVTLYQ